MNDPGGHGIQPAERHSTRLLIIVGLVLVGILGLILARGVLPMGIVVLGLIAGLLEVIPTFGPIIATVPAVLVALVQGSIRFPDWDNIVFALLVIAVYVLLQQLESQIISPRVLGGSVQVPALVVLLAITVGFSVAGVLGAILAVPTVASVRVLCGYAWAKATSVDLSAENAERAPPALDSTEVAVGGRVAPAADWSSPVP